MLVANWPFFGKNRRGDQTLPGLKAGLFFFSLLIYLNYDFERGLGSLALILSPHKKFHLR